jgi:D-sedoheptulose 7-phosphate isomerase
MTMEDWARNISDLTFCLESLSVSDGGGTPLEPHVAFARWRDLTLQIREAGNSIYLIGNGASASMASHIAADLGKNAHLNTRVFTDLSLITAVANDMCYEEVFAEPLRRVMKPGDMLVAISSSGQSGNVLRACKAAQDLGGLVVTVSAMKPTNPLRSLGTLNFYIPSATYGLAETGHAAILHFWVDQMVAVNGKIGKIETTMEIVDKGCRDH